ncbi:MAG TPA: tetratricopeptide repeat protein [Vicinamibacteria bacterium]|nr:tetratricopeptide repeat protein [Vicinamibacteria bacterium]
MNLHHSLVRRAAPVLLLAVLASPALAQSPPDAEMHFTTGVSHLREGRVDLALDEFKRAAKADPKNPYFQKGLGQAYAAKGEWALAIAALRKALELNPYYVDTRNDLGYALVMSGDREGGKKEFLTAFSDPMNPAPEISAYNLGRAYLEEKNYAEATNWLRTSVNRNKAYSLPYLLLAETLLATGRADDAIVQLEAGVREAPKDPDLLLALGRAYLKVGKLAQARMRLDDAVKADPSGPVGRAAAEQLQTIAK